VVKLRTWLGIRPIDVAITAAVIAAVELNVAVTTGPAQVRLDALSYIFGAVISAPILFRRRWPFGVLVACSVLLLVFYTVHRRDISPVPLLAVPLYDAATAGYLAWAIVIPAGFMAIGLLLAAFATREGIASIAADFLPSIALLAVAVALGDTVRGRRALAVETAEKLKLAEEERQAEAGRAVAEERLRIARELHDTVAHAMATISVLSGSALHRTATEQETGPAAGGAASAETSGVSVVDGSPKGADVRSALTAIRQTSKSALAEMRQTLATLRSAEAGGDGQVDADGEQPRTPGLDRLDSLVQAIRAAGAPVSLNVEGVQRPVPPRVGHAAYRILQESLTNVLRHGGPDASATVALSYTNDALTILVTDDGSSCPGSGKGPGSGHGLIGMRERAAAVGGEMTAGPSKLGGFEVRARLPLTSEDLADPGNAAVLGQP
jgi:signal transduction histidine kinase